MDAIFGILLQGARAMVLAASAQSPAAVVEEVQVKSSVSAPMTASCSVI